MPTKTAVACAGHALDLGLFQDRTDSLPRIGRRAPCRQVVQEGKRMRFSSAKLGGQLKTAEVSRVIPERRRMVWAARSLRFRVEVGSLEETRGILIVPGRTPIADMLKVNGELRGIQRPVRSRRSSRGVTTWNQGFSLAIGAVLSELASVEPSCVGVESPGPEVAVGESLRLAPVADDQGGLARRSPCRSAIDRPSIDGRGQASRPVQPSHRGRGGRRRRRGALARTQSTFQSE